MARARTSWAPILWLVAILGVLVLGGFFLWSLDTRRGTSLPEFSVQRTDDRGSAVAFRLFRNAGYKPQVWDQDLTGLRAPGLLILLAPASGSGGMMGGGAGDILPHELQALDRWVSAGNTCVVMTREDIPLYAGLGVFVDQPKGSTPTELVPVQPSALAGGVQKLRIQTQFGFKFGEKKSQVAEALGVKGDTSPPPIPHIPEPQWITLFVQNQGGVRTLPHVLSAARGKGLYVLVNDVFPAGNLGITQADNAQFMLNMARLNPAGGTVWFDEYHKRSVERGFVSYLRERALAPALLYLLLVLGVLFWRTSVRFGAPQPLVADARRDSTEYVKAVAALYQNAGMTREALTILYADLRRRMIGALRLDGLTDLAEVGRRYEARTGRPAREARQVLIDTEAALSRTELEEKDAVQLAARLTQLDGALHRKK